MQECWDLVHIYVQHALTHGDWHALCIVWSSDKLSANNLVLLKFCLSALGRDDLSKLVQEYENDAYRKFAASCTYLSNRSCACVYICTYCTHVCVTELYMTMYIRACIIYYNVLYVYFALGVFWLGVWTPCQSIGMITFLVGPVSPQMMALGLPIARCFNPVS